MKKAGKVFLNGLIKSFICIALVLGAAVLSYHSVFHMFHIPEDVEEVSAVTVREQESITAATLDDISKNLIFCVDDNGEVIKLLLEVYPCAQKRMSYFTIPVETRITMSDSLYQKLILINPSVPQIMKLSGITKHFPEGTAYEYGVLLVEELLDTRMSYYTVVPAKLYETIFQTEEQETVSKETGSNQGDGDKTYPREVFSKDFLSMIHNIQTEEELGAYLEEVYEEVQSNLPLEDKMNYLESYLKLTPGRITFELIAGEKTNSAYVIDRSKAAEQLALVTGQVR